MKNGVRALIARIDSAGLAVIKHGSGARLTSGLNIAVFTTITEEGVITECVLWRTITVAVILTDIVEGTCDAVIAATADIYDSRLAYTGTWLADIILTGAGVDWTADNSAGVQHTLEVLADQGAVAQVAVLILITLGVLPVSHTLTALGVNSTLAHTIAAGVSVRTELAVIARARVVRVIAASRWVTEIVRAWVAVITRCSATNTRTGAITRIVDGTRASIRTADRARLRDILARRGGRATRHAGVLQTLSIIGPIASGDPDDMTLQVGLALQVTIACITVTELSLTVRLTWHAGARWVNRRAETDTARTLVSSGTRFAIITRVRVEVVRAALADDTQVGSTRVIVIAERIGRAVDDLV